MSPHAPVTTPTPATLPVYVGIEKGSYEAQGFEPSYINVANGAAMLPALTAGQVDVTSSTLGALVKLRQAGQQVQAVVGQASGLNYFIYVRNGSGIPTTGTYEEKMKELDGKVIGASG